MPPNSLVQWRFLDGRPGHESQVLGLSEALATVGPAVVVDVPVAAKHRGLRAFLPRQFEHLKHEPRPHLLIGAGHATHAALIRCRQLFGGRSVVLMKPSLPPFLFDLCLVPRHDRLLLPWPNVTRTAGAVNRIRPSQQRQGGRGLVLIGGPSRHCHWSDELVRAGIVRAISAAPLHWTVATSRRTPPTLFADWDSRPQDPDWRTAGNLGAAEIATLISRADRVVVTSDSMSMICESLTSGAIVDLIELPARRSSRLSDEVRKIVRHGFWPNSTAMVPEADRCAALILQHLLPEYLRSASVPSGGACNGWQLQAAARGTTSLGNALRQTLLNIAGVASAQAALRKGEP